ncbi:MAG TPA: hypothetical protein DCX27_06130 [Balneola sp.]|nr:hypothetical protein [Balneola sp.]|tara:strand:- start:867 stop:1133 length:267 start_codon:yes stop_codon:yes gene_type:complete
MSIVCLYLTRETVYDEFGHAIRMAKERLKVPFPHEFSEHQNMFNHPIIIDLEDFVEKDKEEMLTYCELGINIPVLYDAKNNETQNSKA